MDPPVPFENVDRRLRAAAALFQFVGRFRTGSSRAPEHEERTTVHAAIEAAKRDGLWEEQLFDPHVRPICQARSGRTRSPESHRLSNGRCRRATPPYRDQHSRFAASACEAAQMLPSICSQNQTRKAPLEAAGRTYVSISGLRWLRELDLNQRPSGYEPDELPDCSIPRHRLSASETPKGPPCNGSALRLVNGFGIPLPASCNASRRPTLPVLEH